MDVIHVRDCVKAAIIATNERSAIGRTIEIGSGVEVSINELANLIIELSGSSSKIKHLTMRKGEVENSRIRANTKDMEQLLKYKLSITSEDGLRETIEYYRNNLDRYEVYRLDESEFYSTKLEGK